MLNPPPLKVWQYVLGPFFLLSPRRHCVTSGEGHIYLEGPDKARVRVGLGLESE